MKIFLDTADTQLIQDGFNTGLIDGVTTNPTLIMKSGRDPEEVYQEKQIELLNILYDKTKEGGSLFYNHKVRYLNGGATSPWQWLTQMAFQPREARRCTFAAFVTSRCLKHHYNRGNPSTYQAALCPRRGSFPICQPTLCRRFLVEAGSH